MVLNGTMVAGRGWLVVAVGGSDDGVGDCGVGGSVVKALLA